MLASRASAQKFCAALVDLFDKVEVREAHLTGAVPAASEVLGMRLVRAEAVGQKLKFILVLGILALAIDSVDFQKIVNRSACSGSECNAASSHSIYLLLNR